MIESNMSIPEFIDLLDLDQLQRVRELAKAKIEEITGKEKVQLFVFSDGWLNRGWYKTEEEAVKALKDYVNSSKYNASDELTIKNVYEYPDEAEKLLVQ